MKFPKIFKSKTAVEVVEMPKVSFALGGGKVKSLKDIDNKLNQAFKGVVTKTFNSNLRNKIKADPHPFNYKDMDEIYKKVGFMKGIVSKYVNYAVTAGMELISEDDKALKIIETFMDDVDLQYHTKKWLKQACKKGFSPMEIAYSKDARGNKIITGVKVLNSNSIFKVRDEKGKVIKYIQIKKMYGNSMDSMMFDKENIIEFKPEQILELNIDVSGDDPYGLGIIYPNSIMIRNILNAELELHMLMERKANAPIHVKMGWKEAPNGMITVSDSDMNVMKSKLQDLRNDQEWVTSDLVDMSVIDFGDFGKKFKDILDHDLKQFSTGTEVPQVLMGYGNIPEGLAQVQMEDWLITVKSIQDDVSMQFQDRLFKQVLKTNGIQENVKIVWGSQTDEDENQRITQITTILSNQMLNPELRKELELELAGLFNLDKSKIEDSQAKTEALMDQQQAPVPGQNRNLDKKKVKPEEALQICDCNHDLQGMKEECEYYEMDMKLIQEKLEEHPDMTVKEWVGFNYQSFISQILGEIEAYEFNELKAFSEEDLKNGKFSPKQIEKTREVLKEGFEKGKSIREISDDITTQVRPGDLKGVNKNGQNFIVPSTVRAPMIARTECTRMAARGNVSNYRLNNIKEVSYLAVFDERTSQICQDNNGRIFTVQDAMGVIPLHPFCRSTWVPVVNLK